MRIYSEASIAENPLLCVHVIYQHWVRHKIFQFQYREIFDEVVGKGS
jgi:hypothetical protein